jgi:hypothetical protein
LSEIIKNQYTRKTTESARGLKTFFFEPDDPGGFVVWPDINRWTAFNLSGLTQPAGTTVDDVTETESPTALLSVTLEMDTAYDEITISAIK